MSGIKDRARRNIIAELYTLLGALEGDKTLKWKQPSHLRQGGLTAYLQPKLEKASVAILSIFELAIVDRGAELPQIDEIKGYPSLPNAIYSAYQLAQQDMLKEGWVKEIKH